MDIIPAPALKVIGQHLDAVEARSCRLASRHFAPVISKQIATSHVRIVANAFQQQLQDECKQAAAAAAEKNERLLEGVAGLQTAEVRKSAAEGFVQSEGPNHASKQPQATTTAAGSSSSVTGSPGVRSRTSASLARAVAATGYTRAALYVDVREIYDDETWQQIFGALLSEHSSVTSLEVIEYSSSNSISISGRYDAEQLPDPHTMQAHMAPAAATAAAAGTSDLYGSNSRWLPALAAAYTAAATAPGLLHVTLQLCAPLPVDLQPLLLQLTGLKTLKLESTRVWPESAPGLYSLGPVLPVLLPAVLRGLTALKGLEHLSCDMVASVNNEEAATNAVMLDQLFGDLSRHLTHLSFGASNRGTEMCLAAPLVSLHNLQELICQPGLLLDTDQITESLTDYPPLQVTAASGSSSASPRFQVAPSLTKLVLNAGLEHGALLRLLARQRPVAAAAARTQLVHLELNSQMEMPVEMLGQLAGLRHLKTTVQDRRELQALSKTPLTSQLQGLTTVCTQPGEEYDEWLGAKYRPIPLVTPFTSLQTLVVLGLESIAIDPYKDLQALTVITHLKRFEFTGEPSVHAVQQNGVVCRLPGELRSLVLKYHHPYGDRVVFGDAMKFTLGAFPSGMDSVKFQGFYSAVEECEQVADHKVGCTPAAAAAGTAALSSSSSSSRMVQGLAGLKQLSIQIDHLQDAKQWLSHCCNLEHLRLMLDPSGIESGTNTGNAAPAGSGVNPSQCCPILKGFEVVVAAPEDPPAIWRSVDDLFAPVWADVAALTGLHKLSLISEKDSLLFNKTLPYIAALSNLTRLEDLTLQFNLKLTACDVADADQPPAFNGPSPEPQVVFATERQFYEAANHACDRLVSAMIKCTSLKRLEIVTPFVMRPRDPEDRCEYNYTSRPLERRANSDRLELGLNNCLVLFRKQAA